jgi:multicomponent Na+:H+ antiporter subunit B
VSIVINILLLALMGITAIAATRLKNLFGAVMLTGLYSLLSALWFLILDAVDVSFTEAAVGAGVSTVLMLGTLALTRSSEKSGHHTPLLPLFVVLITGGVLVYGTLDMPGFADPNAPIHTHVAPHYIEKSGEEIGVPNIVTSVLASYRGYDTLGETAVIFTAGIGVLLLLGIGRRREGDDP